MSRRVEARLLRSEDRPAVLAHLASNVQAPTCSCSTSPTGWARRRRPAKCAPRLRSPGAATRSSASSGCDRASSSTRRGAGGDRGVPPDARIAGRGAGEEPGGRRRVVLAPAQSPCLSARARRSDRDGLQRAGPGREARGRRATPSARARRCFEDLDWLVEAARESLREESRPDPFAGDARGFRRWVRGRVARARVVEEGGRIVFAGYADVQRPEGWLLQGIYTRPEARRRGHASVGVSDLCRAAFASRRRPCPARRRRRQRARPLALREPRLQTLRQAAHDPLLVAAESGPAILKRGASVR